MQIQSFASMYRDAYRKILLCTERLPDDLCTANVHFDRTYLLMVNEKQFSVICLS